MIATTAAAATITLTPNSDGATILIRCPKSKPEPPTLIRLGRIALARRAVLVERFADYDENGYLYEMLKYLDGPLPDEEASLVVAKLVAHGNWTGSL